MSSKVLLAIEFLVLFFGIPLFIYFDKDIIHPSAIIIPILVFIFLVLRYTTDFRFKELFRWEIPKPVLLRSLLVVLGCFGLMLGYVLIFERENLFNLPKANPWIFVAMCFFYPVFSAFGQEVIYRTFLFRRYQMLFPMGWPLILASGITFSFVHIVYYDPVSLILSFMGGIYFARVYQQTGSVLFSSVLHGLMGILIFGVGLGQYFWLDIPV